MVDPAAAAAKPAVPPNARIKGSSLRPFFGWCSATLGAERVKRALAQVPGEYQRLFDPASPEIGVLDSVWYPAAAMHPVMDALFGDMTPAERSAHFRDGSRAAVQSTRKGVYRWFFVVIMTPERYLARAQALFSRYYEPGVITKTETAPRTHLTVVTGWTGHHPFICETLFWSSMAIYEAMDCQNVTGERLGCISDGAPACRWSIRWEGPR